MQQLKQESRDSQLGIELINGWNYTASPSTGPVMTLLEEAVKAHIPDAIVAPWLAPTGSDSARFRAPQTAGSQTPGIPSFGFFPVDCSGLTETIHGNNERFPMDQVFSANQIYTEAVVNLAR